SLAVLAAVNFGVLAPSLLYIAGGLLLHVVHVVPAFQVPAAEFAFGVLLIASALPWLFNFNFVVRQLRRDVFRAVALDCRIRTQSVLAISMCFLAILPDAPLLLESALKGHGFSRRGIPGSLDEEMFFKSLLK